MTDDGLIRKLYRGSRGFHITAEEYFNLKESNYATD